MSQHMIINTILVILVRIKITKSTQHPDNTQKTVERFWHFILRNCKQSNKSE